MALVFSSDIEKRTVMRMQPGQRRQQPADQRVGVHRDGQGRCGPVRWIGAGEFVQRFGFHQWHLLHAAKPPQAGCGAGLLLWLRYLAAVFLLGYGLLAAWPWRA